MPLPEQMDNWRAAAAMVRGFWQRLADDAAVSNGFRAIASAQLAKLDTARARFG